jgi:aquaporin Z
MNQNAARPLIAEFLGTFCLVFAGTAAIVVNDLNDGVVTHVGIALTFGLIVLAMIYAIGDVSGAHINPAVTFAFYVGGRFPLKSVLPYIVCQCGGAILASVCLTVLFPDSATLGMTTPSGTITQTFVLEVILTFMLMFVILSVSTGAKEEGVTAATAIGAVVGLEALLGGPISGASMNPARSLGPALICGNLGLVWIYIAAPVLGALMAVPFCKIMRADCCSLPGAKDGIPIKDGSPIEGG